MARRNRKQTPYVEARWSDALEGFHVWVEPSGEHREVTGNYCEDRLPEIAAALLGTPVEITRWIKADDEGGDGFRYEPARP